MFMHASPGAAFYTYVRLQGRSREVPEALEAGSRPSVALQVLWRQSD